MRRPVVVTLSSLSVAMIGLATYSVGAQGVPLRADAVSADVSAAAPAAKTTKSTSAKPTKTKKTKSTKVKTTKTKSTKVKTTKVKTTRTKPPKSTKSPKPTSTSPTPTPTKGASGTFTGSTVNTRYGPVQVEITVVDGTITKSTALQSPSGGESSRINSRALPILEQQVLAAQSATIDGVSGATFTSGGYKTSLQSAIDALHAA
ncbi:MAG: FMN-binding protein [Kineosporiaceae bacterium]